MINLSSSVKEKIVNNHVENILTLQLIDVVNGTETVVDTITEENIVSESMTLKQSICDGDAFKYGGCIASEFDIQLLNTESKQFEQGSLTGKYLRAVLTQTYSNGWLYPSQSLYPSPNLYPGEQLDSVSIVLFFGKIDSAKRSESDKNIREITAYDPISFLFKKNIAEVVKDYLRANQPIIQLLVPPITHFTERITDVVTSDWSLCHLYGAALHNYEWMKSGGQINAGGFLRNCCELCCGFGYYRPSEDKIRLIHYNSGFLGEETYEKYESLFVEESKLKPFVGVLFPYGGKKISNQTVIETNKESKNAYYDCANNQVFELKTDTAAHSELTQAILKFHYYDLTDNFLAWDYSADSQADNFKIIEGFATDFDDSDEHRIAHDTDFTPCRLTVEGRPWVEPGDTIKVKIPKTNIYGNYLDSNGNVVETYAEAQKEIFKTRVFNRTLTGIKALTDNIELKGEI